MTSQCHYLALSTGARVLLAEINTDISYLSLFSHVVIYVWKIKPTQMQLRVQGSKNDIPHRICYIFQSFGDSCFTLTRQNFVLTLIDNMLINLPFYSELTQNVGAEYRVIFDP